MRNERLVKVMSSETKLEIIKLLSKRQMTPTDISRVMKKGKSTISEHLDELTKLNIVNKIEQPGKKFVFYSLTKDGHRLLAAKPKIENYIMYGSFLSILAGVMLISRNSQRLYAVSESARAVNQNYIPFLFIAVGLFGLAYALIKRGRLI
ncbi:MAG: winged helix-turn-helix domain-containing protein [Candidatus Aenigmatarchaeota archaeon]|nr:winged helix-turn-helix domain-containing protein [Candidatus Aenigmarchaeota archaeon]